MKLVSVNVGLPQQVIWKGKPVTTSIFKDPVEGRIKLRTLNLDGDRQSDLTVHGGVHKAVYAYPSEHYDYWMRELPGVELPWERLGESHRRGIVRRPAQHWRPGSNRFFRAGGHPTATALLQACG
jgi:MOSC domain-containing protein YiiM